jgi:hypothetical protein
VYNENEYHQDINEIFDYQSQPTIENNDERKKNQKLAGLLMGFDNSFISNIENFNGYLIYQEAIDF